MNTKKVMLIILNIIVYMMKYVCWHGKYYTYLYTRIINTLTYQIVPKIQTLSLDSSVFFIEDELFTF